MLFKKFFAVAFIGAAAAFEIKDALESITKSVAQMDAAIAGWDKKDIVAASKILEMSDTLLATIKSSIKSVETEIKEPLPLSKAVTVLSPSQALTKSTKELITKLIDMKAPLKAVDASLVDVVKKTLSDFKENSTKLVEAIKTKLPDNVKAVSDNVGKNINAELDRGLAAYSAP